MGHDPLMEMPDWLRANVASRNAELRTGGMCIGGASITGHPRRAAYIWHTTTGNEIPLCAECCDAWRHSVDASEAASVTIERFDIEADMPR